MATETYFVNGQKFMWDKDKNLQNLQKHGVLFREATYVFQDVNAMIFIDEEHSHDEERFKIIGNSNKDRLLTVIHCYRNSESVIRIISARKATRMEVNDYVR